MSIYRASNDYRTLVPSISQNKVTDKYRAESDYDMADGNKAVSMLNI